MTQQKLHQINIKFDNTPTVSKYLVPDGYPSNGKKGITVPDNLNVIYAGIDNGSTTGSRALCIVEQGSTIYDAHINVENKIKSMNTTNLFYRPDIGNITSQETPSHGATPVADYKSAGVDHDKNNLLMQKIKTFLPQTGTFSGSYKLFGDCILLATTDGVGTKTIVAQLCDNYSNLGKDIVHHCVNDLLAQGCTKPIFMTDYIASNSIDINVATEIIKSISDACKDVGCKLIGGETAEMPSVYNMGKIDIVGNMVGIANDHDLFDNKDIKVGDKVVGLSSSGLHTNGYSLVRKLFTEDEIKTMGHKLLEPHKCYLNDIKKIKEHVKVLCHITGGGLVDNPKRILPRDCSMVLYKNKIQLPPIMEKIRQRGNISMMEMYRTFNCGIGMLVIVESACTLDDGIEIGSIEKRNQESVIFV